MRIAFVTVAVSCLHIGCYSQDSGIEANVIGSFFFVSQRHATENGEQKLYSEFRLGYRINRYMQVNAFIGHQERSFIYYAKFDNPWQLVPLYMKRNYLPVGINARLYLTEFFYENLKLLKKKGRWDIYNEVGIAVLEGHDTFDSRGESFRNQGAFVPYYLRPYVDEYGKIFFLIMAGLKYNFNKNIGVFIEGGDAALMSLQLGLSCKF